MTVGYQYYWHKYIGLSSDEKPMPVEENPWGLQPGYEFFETDTCDTYVWNGDSWVLKAGLGVKLWDANSTTFKGLAFNAEAPQVCSQPYLYAIAEGDVSGHTNFAKYGRVIAATSAAIDVWPLAKTYVFPSTMGEGMIVVSSNSCDLSTGTGARKIKVDYLDNAYTEKTTEITLTGKTAVVSGTTNMARINRVFVSEAGTMNTPAGNIDIYSTGGTTATVYARVETGLTQTRQAIYSVPAGKTLYVTSVRFSAGVSASNKFQYVIFTTLATVDPDSGTKSTLFYPYNEIGLINDAIEINLESPSKIPQYSDLKIKVQGDTTEGSLCTAAFRGWIE